MFPASHAPRLMIMRGKKRPEERGGVNMLIVGVHFDASLPAWSGLERQAIILHLLSSHYTPVSLSISVLPHPLLSALIPLHALHHRLSPIPPSCFIFLLVLLCYYLPTPQTPLSQNMRYICFPLPGCKSGTRGAQSADVLVSG